MCESGFFGPSQDDTTIGISISPGESEAGGGDGAAGYCGQFEGGMDSEIKVLHGQRGSDSALVGRARVCSGEDLIGICGAGQQCDGFGTATIDTQQQVLAFEHGRVFTFRCGF